MTTSSNTDDLVPLLWTGGWDSTFQLLNLLVFQDRSVAPYYLIDETRKSTGAEIVAMKSIRGKIEKRFPSACANLAPTRYFSVSSIAEDCDITEAFRAIKEEMHIGDQYEWLARFCKEHDIIDMQLSVEARTVCQSGSFSFRRFVSEQDGPFGNMCRIDPRFCGTREYTVFRFFSFPLLRTTKHQMLEVVRENDLESIMEMTWFCHSPISFFPFRGSKLRPCGQCNPCKGVIREGFSWRVPRSSRLIAKLQRAFK